MSSVTSPCSRRSRRARHPHGVRRPPRADPRGRDRGVRRTRVRRARRPTPVATAAGVSQPYVVRMFGTKEKLFLEVLHRALDKLLVARSDARSPRASPQARPGRSVERTGSAWRMPTCSTDRGPAAQPDARRSCSGSDPDDRQGRARRVPRGLQVPARSRPGSRPSEADVFLAHGMMLNTLVGLRMADEYEPTPMRIELLETRDAHRSCHAARRVGAATRPAVTTSGILLVDKPGGVTSHDVVSRARRALGTRKVGHAGTLDPMATGLLHSGRRQFDQAADLSGRLGQGVHGDDPARAELDDRRRRWRALRGRGCHRHHRARSSTPRSPPSPARSRRCPSSFSAIKVDGRRSYERARSGEEVALAARAVTVSRFEILAERRDGAFLDLDVVVDCSSGTYIRALARDLGAALGVGGHLTALRRTAVGPFDVADAVPARRDHARRAARAGRGGRAAVPGGPAVARAGHRPHPGQEGRWSRLADAGVVAALAASGRLVGLVSVRDGVARVLVNFPTAEVLA